VLTECLLVPGQDTYKKRYNNHHSRQYGSKDWGEFQSQLEEVVARAERGRGPGACASMALPPTFNGTTSWAVFRRHFETVAKHDHWTHQDKSAYLITALKGPAADVLHGIPTSATYEETLQPWRTVSEANMLRPHIPPHYPGTHKVRGRQSVRRRGRRPRNKNSAAARRGEKVNEALRKALELQAVLLAARPHKTSTKAFWGSRLPPTRRRDARQPACWSCGEPGHFQGSCPYVREKENDRRRKREDRPSLDTWESPRKSKWRPNKTEKRTGGVAKRREMSGSRRMHYGLPVTCWLSLRKMPTLTRSHRTGSAISCLVGQLLAPQDELFSMELVSGYFQFLFSDL
jgi:hypothetical protein